MFYNCISSHHISLEVEISLQMFCKNCALMVYYLLTYSQHLENNVPISLKPPNSTTSSSPLPQYRGPGLYPCNKKLPCEIFTQFDLLSMLPRSKRDPDSFVFPALRMSRLSLCHESSNDVPLLLKRGCFPPLSNVNCYG